MLGQPLLFAVLDTLSTALFVYTIVLLVYVIFSWVPRPPEPLLPLRAGSAALVDPVLRPLRARIPALRLGGVALDLSIIILFIGARVLQSLLRALAAATV